MIAIYKKALITITKIKINIMMDKTINIIIIIKRISNFKIHSLVNKIKIIKLIAINLSIIIIINNLKNNQILIIIIKIIINNNKKQKTIKTKVYLDLKMKVMILQIFYGD